MYGYVEQQLGFNSNFTSSRDLFPLMCCDVYCTCGGGVCALGGCKYITTSMYQWFLADPNKFIGRLGGGFNYFLFSPLSGEDSHFD